MSEALCRVAMICGQIPPVYGGAGTQALALGKQLAKDGCAVSLFGQNQAYARRREEIEGVMVFRAPGEVLIRRLPRRPAELVRTLVYAAWLAWALRRRDYDVLHAHGSYWYTIVPAIYARLFRIPLVLKVTRLDEDDARTVAQKTVHGVRIGWLYAVPHRAASAVIALNDEIAERERRHFPGSRIETIPNGVDVATHDAARARRADIRRKLGFAPDTDIVLFVGYLVPHKGVPELLAAWDELAERMSPHGRGRRLALVGPVTGFYRELEASVIESLSARAASGVTPVGHVSPSDVVAYYAAADAFVLPTRAEGMPNSLLEALAAGLPVVTTHAAGVDEVVAGLDGVTQIADVDRSTLVAAIAELLDVPIAQRPTTRLPERFTLVSVAERYRNLYAELSGRSLPTPGPAVNA
jgi:glycosyltransferase involved in cell wall biosynthesis